MRNKTSIIISGVWGYIRTKKCVFIKWLGTIWTMYYTFLVFESPTKKINQDSRMPGVASAGISNWGVHGSVI